MSFIFLFCSQVNVTLIFWTGLDLTRNGSANDPVEGSNVILICRAYALSSEPQWAYYDNANDAGEKRVDVGESDTLLELGG